MTASDKCTNLIKYVLLCRSHPHTTFARGAGSDNLSSMLPFPRARAVHTPCTYVTALYGPPAKPYMNSQE